MSRALDELVELLELEPLEVNLFRGRSPDDDRQRVFGGQVAAQALVAAGRTVDADLPVHSLHAYFLRPGDTQAPIVYDVDRIRDGRSFVTRRVVAIQHGRAIFNMQASFHRTEPGLEHHDAMPDVPAPESLPAWNEHVDLAAGTTTDGAAEWLRQERPIDARRIEDGAESLGGAVQSLWMRADGVLGDDPLLHACVVAYASDIMLLDTVILPHLDALAGSSLMQASLDHAMWFHQPCRADEWLLFHLHSPSASGARGFVTGSVFRRDGMLAASVAQEGLVRIRR